MENNSQDLSTGDSAQVFTGAGEKSLPFHIPADIRYNCQGCGRCCGGWAIGLTEDDYAKVKDVAWGSLHPDLKDGELFVHREQEYQAKISSFPHYTKARKDGTCSFLIDGLCFIHKVLGAESKPRNCQLFPYTFTPTPEGIYVGLLYNSMAAVRNIGNPLSEQEDMLRSLWQTSLSHEHKLGSISDEVYEAARQMDSSQTSSLRFDVNLTPGIPLSWEEYISIEKLLLTFIQQGGSDILPALLACSELLAEALRLKRSGETLSALSQWQPNISGWLKSSASGAELMFLKALYFKNLEWPNLRKQRSHQWEMSNNSPLSDSGVISAAMSTIFLGQTRLSTPKKVSINQARKSKVAQLTAEQADFLRRYIYLKIFAKKYCGASLAGLSLISGFNNLIGNLLCSLIYAKAHAQISARKFLIISDLYDAFYCADIEMVNLSQLTRDRAAIYDLGFKSPCLFSRLLGELASTFS